MLTLIQISDCHLFQNPEAQSLKVGRSEQAFDNVLAHIKQHYANLDGLIVSGDIAEDYVAVVYKRLKHKLNQLNCPIMAIAGNHDDKTLLKKFLPESKLFFEHWQVLGLDSAHKGQYPYSGRLLKKDLSALDKQLKKDQRFAILVLHHPALLFADTWIREMVLDNQREFEALIEKHSHVKAISWGHIHQAVTIEHSDRLWLSNPSTCVQFDVFSQVFKRDRRRRVGYRVLLLEESGQVTTDVHWVRLL